MVVLYTGKFILTQIKKSIEVDIPVNIYKSPSNPGFIMLPSKNNEMIMKSKNSSRTTL